MASTFRLGRIAGIEIGAHWSLMLVVALIVWSLGARGQDIYAAAAVPAPGAA